MQVSQVEQQRNRALMTVLLDAAAEAAAAVGLRGVAAKRAMREEHKRRETQRWAWIVKRARAHAWRAREDDYRDTLRSAQENAAQDDADRPMGARADAAEATGEREDVDAVTQESGEGDA